MEHIRFSLMTLIVSKHKCCTEKYCSLLDDSNEVELKLEPKGNSVTLISCDQNEKNLKY